VLPLHGWLSPPSWGLPGPLPPRATARGTSAPVLGSSLKCPVFRLARRGPKVRAGSLSWDFAPYGTCEPGGSGCPGVSTPRHLPPSGFDSPLDGLLPPGPDDDPSIAAAPMGFLLQGLAPPCRRYPLRGLASPVVSPDGPHRTRTKRSVPAGFRPGATPEVDSDREGTRSPARRSAVDGPSLALLEFAPPGLSPAPPWDRLPGPKPLMPLDRKCSLRSTSGRGFRGLCERRKRLASLEASCPPGVSHLSYPTRLGASAGPGLWLHLGMEPASRLQRPLRKRRRCPTGVPRPVDFGAAVEPDTRHRLIFNDRANAGRS